MHWPPGMVIFQGYGSSCHRAVGSHLASSLWGSPESHVKKIRGSPGIYPLVMTNSLPWNRWPIEIDGLPIKNGDFPWQTVK